MTAHASRAQAVAALTIGRELVLDLFQVWRRDLLCRDALILLVVAMGNVDGVLFSQELRRRYGGAFPIAPDALRQPISAEAVALSLGLEPRIVRRRIGVLARAGECQITAQGMLITEQQLEAADRTGVVRAAYELVGRAWRRLDALGVPMLGELPDAQVSADAAPVRSAAAHGAKYVLRTLDLVSRHAGGVLSALLLLELTRSAQATPAPTASLAKALGLSLRATQAEARRLRARGLCTRRAGGLMLARFAPREPWMTDVLRRNQQNLYQLAAALAEVGALAAFAAADRRQAASEGLTGISTDP